MTNRNCYRYFFVNGQDDSEWVVDKNVNPFHYAKSKRQY